MSRSRRTRPLVWAALIVLMAVVVHFWNAQLESERIPRIIAQTETLVRDVSARRPSIESLNLAADRIRDSVQTVLEDRIAQDSVSGSATIEVVVTPLKNANDRATHELDIFVNDAAIIGLRVTWIDAQDHFVIIGYEIPQGSDAASSSSSPQHESDS